MNYPTRQQLFAELQNNPPTSSHDYHTSEEIADVLEAYEQEMRDEVPSFYDSEAMAKKCPALVDDLQKSNDFFWENLRHEWLHGDRSSSGLLGAIRKAASVVYNTKADTLTIKIDDDEAADLLNADNYDEKPPRVTIKNIKALIIDDIETGQHNQAAKNKAEAEKRRAERERVADYRAKRNSEAADARRAELDKMTK